MAGDEAMTESRVSRLEEGVESLKTDMRHVISKLDEFASFMAGLVRMEEKNQTHSSEIQRSFREIDEGKQNLKS